MPSTFFFGSAQIQLVAGKFCIPLCSFESRAVIEPKEKTKSSRKNNGRRISFLDPLRCNSGQEHTNLKQYSY